MHFHHLINHVYNYYHIETYLIFICLTCILLSEKVIENPSFLFPFKILKETDLLRQDGFEYQNTLSMDTEFLKFQTNFNISI